MKRIAVIAFAVALGLAWTGVAIPADTKETLKDKGETTKDKLKDAGETTKDKMKDAGEKVKDKAVELKDKAKAKISGDKDDMDKAGRSARVRSAQQALTDKGYNPGPADGLMGPRTRAAVEEFQRKEGLEANGGLDMKTMSRLGSSNSAPSVSPVQRQGASTTKP